MRRLVPALLICLAGGCIERLDAQVLPPLRPGSVIWVTTTDGRAQRGVVESGSPSRLGLRVDGLSRAFAADDVQRIEMRDQLTNGARNGAIAGAAAMAGLGFYISYALCEIPDGCLPQDLWPIARISTIGAGIGVFGGLLVDYLIPGRRVVYDAGAGRPRVGLTIDTRRGVRVDARWTWSGW
jgi:hypothetical protein